MRIINSYVSPLHQQEEINDMYRHIERCGRISYKSEDKITDESWIRFKQIILEKGHWSVFEHGTVYLVFPTSEKEVLEIFEKTVPFTRWEIIDGKVYLTTNYRIILQRNLQEFMEKYWSIPTENHYHRETSIWVCSRSTGNQIIRHRAFSVTQESQRYCNYSRGKFNEGLTFILPQWIYRVRQDIGNTVDPITGILRKDILALDGEILWDTLTCYDRTVSSRDDFWKKSEEEYLYELKTDEGESLKPEEARGALCNDVKTEIALTGYVEDWFYTPSPDCPEKVGFFYLRCAKDAQADVRVLAQSLKETWERDGTSKLK